MKTKMNIVLLLMILLALVSPAMAWFGFDDSNPTQQNELDPVDLSPNYDVLRSGVYVYGALMYEILKSLLRIELILKT